MEFRKTAISDLKQIRITEQRYAEFVGQWSFEQHQAALSNDAIAHIVFYDALHTYIGYAIVRGLTSADKSIELMRIAMDRPDNGYGKDAIQMLLAWCFNELHAHRVWLDVRACNARAQRVYTSMGFVQEGLLRECIVHNGTYESLLVMSILESEYKKCTGKSLKEIE